MNRFPSNASVSSGNGSAGSSSGALLFDFPSSSSVTSEGGSTDYRSDVDESFSDYGPMQIKGNCVRPSVCLFRQVESQGSRGVRFNIIRWLMFQPQPIPTAVLIPMPDTNGFQTHFLRMSKSGLVHTETLRLFCNVKVYLHQESTSMLQQLSDDISNTVLIENNGVAPDWSCNPFSSDTVVFNEKRITSIITGLSER